MITVRSSAPGLPAMRGYRQAPPPEVQAPGTARGTPSVLTINTSCCIVTARGILGYEEVLGIPVQWLNFKRVLDIGSGEGVFVQVCSELGIDIVGIGPIYGSIFGKGHNDFVDDEHLRWIARSLSRQDRPVGVIAAVNEALPFKDETFDYVLGSRSSIEKASVNYPDPEQRELAVRKMLEEIVRVLKPGGEARVTCLEAVTALAGRTLQEDS